MMTSLYSAEATCKDLSWSIPVLEQRGGLACQSFVALIWRVDLRWYMPGVLRKSASRLLALVCVFSQTHVTGVRIPARNAYKYVL